MAPENNYIVYKNQVPALHKAIIINISGYCYEGFFKILLAPIPLSQQQQKRLLITVEALSHLAIFKTHWTSF